MSFDDLGLAEPLLRAVHEYGYTTPTPIQAQAIPTVLSGADLMGGAQTGTGKTAGFVLPMLHRLMAKPAVHDAKGRLPIRALILTPTRELAAQVEESVRTYGKHAKLSSMVMFGGVGMQPQIDKLRRGVDILVATPGRLLDLVKQHHVRLDGAHHLILDEADRMFDMGFIKDVRRIVAMLPKDRQSMLFSATMPREIVELIGEVLYQYERIEVSPPTLTADRVEQRVIAIEQRNKRALLSHLLADPALGRVIVFTRTKHVANRVAEHLGKTGVSSDAIHGNKSQNARQRALDGFKAGKVRVLVATDIAARGVDVDNVTHVINFELPNEPESYVHRIGRTARAGTEGIAISFCDPSEKTYLRDIERLVKRPLTVVEHKLPAEALQPVNVHEERRNYKPEGRNYKQPKRRWNPRGPRRKAA